MSKQIEFFFFWQNSVCSQWYKSKFVIDGITFVTAEQWMMYKKAILFNDQAIATEILKCTNPRQQKSLGQKVKNFNEDTWKMHREEIVYMGNYAKFTQNKSLHQFMLHPNNRHKIFVEASPFDKIWGIGLGEDDVNADKPHKWKGLNLLGKILTKLRDDLVVEANSSQ